MQPQLMIRRLRGGHSVQVGGTVDAASAQAFAFVLTQDVKALTNGDPSIDIDLEDLELDDGSAVVEAVNAVRDLLLHAPVVLRRAPQMLAHTLYKAGMLQEGRLELVLPREEEATSS